MTKLDYIKALETIKNYLCEVIGAMKVEYFKENNSNSDNTQDVFKTLN